jgi:hypothetical protein
MHIAVSHSRTHQINMSSPRAALFMTQRCSVSLPGIELWTVYQPLKYVYLDLAMKYYQPL